MHRKAFLLAVEKHKHQKYGNNPYIVHLYDVVNVLIEFGYAYNNLLAAAWLHDCIEDTDANYNDIRQATNKNVAEIVLALTDEIGRNRKERKEKTLPKLVMFPDALAIKLADIIANCRDAKQSNSNLLKMYKKEFPGFKEKCYVFEHGFDEMWNEIKEILE
jgi:(p)ppGpp synthase/HD superfamily hydrolase